MDPHTVDKVGWANVERLTPVCCEMWLVHKEEKNKKMKQQQQQMAEKCLQEKIAARSTSGEREEKIPRLGAGKTDWL